MIMQPFPEQPAPFFAPAPAVSTFASPFETSTSNEASANIGVVNQSSPSDSSLIQDAARQMDDAVMVPKAGVAPQPMEMTSPANPFDTTMAPAPSFSTPNLTYQANPFDTPMTPAPSFPTPDPIRVDVEFYFALITTAPNPDYTTYMTKVSAAAAGASMRTSSVSFSSEALPYIRNVVPDGSYYDTKGRPDAKKFVVYAAVPVFVSSAANTAEARGAVLSLLREAVQTGSLNA